MNILGVLTDWFGPIIDSFFSMTTLITGAMLAVFGVLASWLGPILAVTLARLQITQLFGLVNAWVINLTRGFWENNLLRRSMDEKRLLVLLLPRTREAFVEWASQLAQRLDFYIRMLESMKVQFEGPYSVLRYAASEIRPEFRDHLQEIKTALDQFFKNLDIYMHVTSDYQEDVKKQTKKLYARLDRCEKCMDGCGRRYRRLFREVVKGRNVRANYRQMNRLNRKRSKLRRIFLRNHKRLRKIRQTIFRSYEDKLVDTAKEIIRIDDRSLRAPIHELVTSAEIFRGFASTGRIFNILVDKKDPEAQVLRTYLDIPEDCPWDVEGAKVFMLNYLGKDSSLGPFPPREDIFEHYVRKLHATERPESKFSKNFLDGLMPAGTRGLAQPHYRAEHEPPAGKAPAKTQTTRTRRTKAPTRKTETTA